MNRWFVLQVISNKENIIENHINKLNLKNLKAFIPQKRLKIKKNGILKESLKPIYPGYIFIIGCWDLIEAKKISQLTNTVKFIGGLNTPGSLKLEEIEIIKNITNNGISEYSKVVKSGTKIKVISGPLKKLEGEIISVDRRKQRAIVKMQLLNSEIKVTLGFEYIETNQNV